jgi:hypothetical protein
MSIQVVCPGCSAKLNAPESAAGKRVKCPKCQAAVPVPALVTEFEVVEPEPAAPPEPERPARPAPRPARNADDDRPRKRARAEDEEEDRPRKRKRDDEDDEEDRPRKKVRKAGGVPPVLLFGGIAAGVLAVGFAVYWFGFREESGGGTAQNGPGPAGPNEPNGPKPAAPPVPPPEGWKEFTFERDGFKAYFPAEPKTGATIKSSRPVGGAGQPFYRSYEYRSQESWADLACTVRVFELPANSTPQQRQTFADQVCAPSRTETGETVASQGAATLGGVEGKEAVGETDLRPTATSPKTTSDGRPMPSKLVSANRWMVTGNRCYHLKVVGHNTRHKDADAFFDNFALTNPPAPKPKDGGGTTEPKQPITPPAGWAAYQPPGAGFKVLMPPDVKVTDATTKLPSKFGKPMLESVKLHRATDAAGVVCEVRVVQFSSVVQNSADQSNAISDVLTAPVFEKRVRSGSGGSKTVTWAGKPARERAFAMGQGMTRETHTATGGIVVAVYVPNGTPDPEKVRAFLESFEFTN